MYLKTKALVLSSSRYDETGLIVKCLTTQGIFSCLLKGILKAKRARLQSGVFFPLSQLELVMSQRKNGGLEYIKEASQAYSYQSLYLNPFKNFMALFIKELLLKTLRDHPHDDERLLEFISIALRWLDTHEEISNFHLIFAIQLTKYLGFYPGETAVEPLCFNLREGLFTNVPTPDCIKGEEAEWFYKARSLTFDSAGELKLNGESRQRLLGAILDYYRFHVDDMGPFRSPEILHQILH